MILVKPRMLVHQGVVNAAALFFDMELLGEAEARRRVLALWEPGSVVHAVAGGLLLRFAHAREIDCRHAPGLPLTMRGHVLTGTPLTQNEWEEIAPPPHTVCLIQNGGAILHTLTDETRADPAAWLDIAAWPVLPAKTLGAPLAPPQVFESLTKFDPRKQLAGIPEASPDLLILLKQLRERTAAPASSGAGLSATKSLKARLRMLLRSLALRASAASQPANPGGEPGRSGSKAGGAAGAPFTPPMWLSRLAFQFLNVTYLGRIFGMRQAQYLSRTMQMFERGDFAEALRHALPLGGADGQPGNPWPMLNLPSRRDNLQISPGLTPAGSSVLLGPNLYEGLQQMYRKAFARLEAEGRIDEAAFVLAELLHAHEEAVAFLERHGRLHLAAEIAEARSLPPGLVVRQWFLAGDAERAAAIARRTGAFGDAITRLERANQPHAQTLRIVWAGTLAKQGDYSAAVDVAWPVPEGRALTHEWIRRAMENGGPAAARMLARRLTLEPESYPEIRERALALLAGDAPEHGHSRLAFAQALMDEPRTPAAAALARAAARTLMEDAAAGTIGLGDTWLPTLIKFAGDGALKADLPAAPNCLQPLMAAWDAPLEIVIDASDTGALPVLDAAWLPDGRCVVALGEGGARLIARDGRTIAHLDQPAHRLVVSDSGDRALALAPRGDATRIARLDLRQHTARPWRDVQIDSWADTYDGSLWFTACKTDFLAIDVLADEYKALWRTPEIPGRVTNIARDPISCSFLVFHWNTVDSQGNPADAPQFTCQRWLLSLPTLALRARPELPEEPNAYFDLRRTVAPGGQIADLQLQQSAEEAETEDASMILYLYEGSGVPQRTKQLRLEESGALLSITMASLWIAATTQVAGGVCCHIIDTKSLAVRLKLKLMGARTVTTRVGTDYVTIGDDRGRLIVIDLLRGHLVRNLRVG